MNVFHIECSKKDISLFLWSGMQNVSILVIDDEEGIRFSLRGILEDEGYEVYEVASGKKAFALLKKQQIDICFLDVWLPEMDGLEILQILEEQYPDIPVIMISGHATIETAVKAIKYGAYDFIEKPLSLEKVLITILRAVELRMLKKENAVLRGNLQDKNIFKEIIGNSEALNKVKESITHVAPTDASVLLTGENGTGKELTARVIHAASNRAEKPFIAVNCAALPEELIESELFGYEKGAFTGADKGKMGRFELADGGTLFLDEIGDMTLKTQVKILRILQEKILERLGGTKQIPINVRIIAATNKDLEKEIYLGLFREDLYYRLRVFPIELPPLRARTADIPSLLYYFTDELAQKYSMNSIEFTKETLDVLVKYRWYGNIRELRNLVERLLILHHGKKITPELLPLEYHTGMIDNTLNETNDFKEARMAFEKQFLYKKLHEVDGNISKLAEIVGLERSYLHKKLKSYSII